MTSLLKFVGLAALSGYVITLAISRMIEVYVFPLAGAL